MQLLIGQCVFCCVRCITLTLTVCTNTHTIRYRYSVDGGKYSAVGAAGSVYFQCSDVRLEVRAGQEELVIYRAHINLGKA